MGQTLKDGKGRFDFSAIVEAYPYNGGLLQKLRDASKNFLWQYWDGERWHNGRNGLPHIPYIAGTPSDIVMCPEGEKDADTFARMGYYATSTENGAGRGDGKFYDSYLDTYRDKTVYIFVDNDAVGKDFGQFKAERIFPVAKVVKVLDPSTVYPLPEHGDITDIYDACGEERTKELIQQLIDQTPEWKPAEAENAQTTENNVFALFKPLTAFEEQEAEWIVDGWIPKGQIALLGADGGVGKTTLWVNIVAALSSGQRCILDSPDYERTPAEISFLTTEDSVRKKLAKKLRLAGACASNIYTPDFLCDTTGALRDFKFGSPLLAEYVRKTRHKLYVFDPVQGFIPPDVNMSSRNAMRDCLAPLIALGEETGSTFLIIVHTNKRKGASGRDRLADSADLWDIARSVIMSGFTDEQGVRYLSNEKNNYTALQETVLYSIDDEGQVVREGTTWKRDREFMQEISNSISAPKRADCKGWLLTQIDEAGGELLTKEIERRAQSAGFSTRTLRRAKDELKSDGKIRYTQTGNPKEKAWAVKLTNDQRLIELPPTTWTPWNT